MLKNIIGSIVFVAAVFALVNFIGDAMVSPTTSPSAQPRPQRPAVPQIQAAPQATPQATPQAAPVPAQDDEQEDEQEAEQETGHADEAMAMAGDAKEGKTVFRKKCMGCHTVGKGEANRTGPNLWGIIGKAKAAAEGYRYSTSMQAMGGVWSEDEINGFIAGPRTFLPDTKMTFAGLKKEQDRADVLAYLKSLKD